jgi:ABC-2 type transport system ATP-binding protein
MLEVKQLTRRYGQFLAVDNVSFAIGKGEIVGLLGHNGAGKTTIMKMLSGYLEPDEGSIAIGGIGLAEDAKAVQQMLGYLPESLPVYPEMTVADYLDYAAQLKGLADEERVVEIKRAIRATDIQAKLLSPIATLSRGYKQRVGVAQALLGRPKVLILDEPTNGLDPTQTDHMRQLIRQVAQEATVILSTHIMQEVDALCDRVLILSGGRLAVDERLDALRRSQYIKLDSSMAPQEAEQHLGTLASVAELSLQTPAEPIDHRYQYRLKLAANQDVATASAQIAKTVINAKADLYSLQPEQRDLESLFREVSQAPRTQLNKINPDQREGLNNAA